MKRLSNSELRILYTRRSFLDTFMHTLALHMNDNWSDCLDRMNAVRAEIKSIVDDPQFDTLVSKPKMSRPGQQMVSAAGTIINVMASARELTGYIDATLSLYITQKSVELKQEPMQSAKVFIGHGRNEIVRNKVKDFIRDRCCLDPLVLQELPSSGMTIIEKLERYSRTADYAVLILTGDDVIGESDLTRARQNVIQELGWFQGTIGRNRTALLVERGVEIASNISGVVSLEFSENTVEVTFESLRKEFEDAKLLAKPNIGHTLTAAQL